MLLQRVGENTRDCRKDGHKVENVHGKRKAQRGEFRAINSVTCRRFGSKK